MNQDNNNPLWDNPENFLPKDDEPVTREDKLWAYVLDMDSDYTKAMKHTREMLEKLTSCIETISGDQRALIKLVGEIIDGLANSREIHQSIDGINETFDVMNSNMEGIVGMVSDITEWISNTNKRLNKVEAQPIANGVTEMPRPMSAACGPSLGSEGGDTCVTPRPLGKDNTRVTHPRPRPDYSADVTYDQELPRPRRYQKAVGLCRLALDVVGALGIGALIAYLFRLLNG